MISIQVLKYGNVAISGIPNHRPLIGAISSAPTIKVPTEIVGISYAREIGANPSVMGNGLLTSEKWAKVSGVKGNSVVWNQLVQGAGTITLTGGRKYLVNTSFNSPSTDTQLAVEATDCVYDLTQMFGSGNEPTTIEEFESRKPLGVGNEYNPGEIISYQQWGEKVVWNQLVNGILSYAPGLTVLSNDDNSITVNGNPSRRWTQVSLQVFKNNLAGHILYMNVQKISGNYTHGTNDLGFCDGYATETSQVSLNGGERIYKAPSLSTFGILGNTDGVGDSYDNYTARFIVIDLTLMFGEGNEPTTIEEFERRRPRNVTDEYNEGTEINGDISLVSVANDTTATTPLPNVSLIKDADGNQLFPYGLLSAGSVYDEITETKAIKRIGVVDMGTKDWFYDPSRQYFRFNQQDFTFAVGVEGTIQIICATFSVNPCNYDGWIQDYAPDNSITLALGASNVRVKYSKTTDTNDFKAAMQGVLLYYELAEPIEVDISKWKAEYKVEQGGTEHIVSANDTTNLKADIIYGDKV